MGYYSRHQKPDYLTDPALLARIVALGSNSNADDWTRNFCASIAAGFKQYKGLTERQHDIFAKCEARNDPKNIEEREEWRASYTDEHRRIAGVCAAYYKANPPYFADLVARVLSNPEFIPSKRQYGALCANKYAKKVLKAHDADAAFAVGSFVQLRASGRYGTLGPLNRGTIIAVDASPVVSAARGSKIYQVLPFGSPSTVNIQERYLKKLRGTKNK
jgi:hypothetical protein